MLPDKADLVSELYDHRSPPQAPLDWIAGRFDDRRELVAATTTPDPIMWNGRGFVILALDAFGDPLDLVTWNVRSDSLDTRYQRTAMLGEDSLYAPREGALRIWRSPLSWLKSGRRGVVLISPKRAAARLEGISIAAEDDAHARDLRRLLARPAPPIAVRRAA